MTAPLHAGRQIRTFTGRYVDIWELKAEDVALEDIAHALSNICRYNGHIPENYSVAEHSFRVMSWVLNQGVNDPVVLMQALLHDAAEAYISDLARPIKYELSQYRELEAKLEEKLFPILGVPFPLDPIVKEADNAVLRYEWDNYVVGPFSNERHWTHKEAEAIFLDAYKHLKSRIEDDVSTKTEQITTGAETIEIAQCGCLGEHCDHA